MRRTKLFGGLQSVHRNFGRPKYGEIFEKPSNFERIKYVFRYSATLNPLLELRKHQSGIQTLGL